MSRDDVDTAPQQDTTGATPSARDVPGVAVVFAGQRAVVRALPLVDGRVVVGRLDACDDGLVSREHVELARDGRGWRVRDLGSRNGTFVDGERLERPWHGERPRVVRIGDCLLVPMQDVSRLPETCRRDGHVAGAALSAALTQVRAAAWAGRNLLIEGESGTGKELAASVYHRGRGPLISVNGAAVPAGMAERLFLGARRGAYSGASSDAPGYFEAAEGGVLFLDEIGELELELQAKLLRVLETGEVLPLGATRPRKVDVRVCFATHRDLAQAVAAGRFRADLYYRIGRPHVQLPPLRERPEEVAFLIELALERFGAARAPHARLVEACLLRPWPGNVRELLAEVRDAAARAAAEGSDRVKLGHLAERAGRILAVADAPVVEGSAARVVDAVVEADPERRRVVAALEAHGYNVRAAAEALGLHRTQLYREMRRLGVEVRRSVS